MLLIDLSTTIFDYDDDDTIMSNRLWLLNRHYVGETTTTCTFTYMQCDKEGKRWIIDESLSNIGRLIRALIIQTMEEFDELILVTENC